MALKLNLSNLKQYCSSQNLQSMRGEYPQELDSFRILMSSRDTLQSSQGLTNSCPAKSIGSSRLSELINKQKQLSSTQNNLCRQYLDDDIILNLNKQELGAYREQNISEQRSIIREKSYLRCQLIDELFL